MIISVEIMGNFVKDSIPTPPTIGYCRFTIMFHVKHNSADTLSTTTAHCCSISLHAYISAMKRYGVRQPLQEFEKFLEMFWLCYV